jgi:hypothetical protein
MILKWTVYQELTDNQQEKADTGNPKNHKKTQPKLPKINCSAKPSRQKLINSSRRVTQVAAKEKNSAAAWREEGRSQRAA